MAPALLLHDILHHRYKPPDQFVKAVIEGRILAANNKSLTMVFFMVSTLMTTGRPAPALNFCGLLIREWA